MSLRHALLALLALPLLPPAPAAQGSARPRRAPEVHIPSLAAFSLQDLQVPRDLLGEPVALVVDIDGAPYTFDLRPHSLRTDDFRLIEVVDGLPVGREAPPVSTYRGDVYDPTGTPVAGARVVGSEAEAGWSLAVDLPGRSRILVQPLVELAPEVGHSGWYVVHDQADELPEGDFTCGTEGPELGFALPEPEPGNPPVAFAAGDFVLELAIDTDVEFTNLNGGNVNQTLRDIEQVMNLVSATYERDIDIAYELTTVVVRTGNAALDPYTATAPGTVLSELGSEWSQNTYSSVRRDLVHLMTGKDLDSSVIGIAFLSVVCSQSSGRGLSQSRFSSSLNSRAALTAHELGHNWSASHCDGNGRCFIMCSALGGCEGIGNPILFGRPSRNTIASYRNTRTCLDIEAPHLVSPFFEDWAVAAVDPGKWTWNDGVAIGSQASAEPTPGFSMVLNSQGTDPGEQDDIRTNFIDTSGASGLRLSFFSQHVGVEADEELVVQYRNSADDLWLVAARIKSDGIDQTEFQYFEFPFQANMYHDRFRLRFRVKTDEANDLWFVDNVLVHDGPNLAQDPLVRGALFDSELHGVAAGQSVVFVASLTAGGPLGSGLGPSFFGGNVVLDVVAPLFNLGIVAADGSGVAKRTLFMPFTVAIGTPVWTQALALKPDLTKSEVSNPVAQVVQ